MSEVDQLPAGYGDLLAAVKAEVAAARVRAARAVNTELIGLYWAIGRRILDSQHAEGWGTRVIDRLPADLRAEFPGMRGFSPRSLIYMRTFADRYPDPIAQQPVAQLPWRHITTLLDKVPDAAARDWYAARDAKNGWSTAVLAHHISTDLRSRSQAGPHNFPDRLPRPDSDLARELVKDPYVFDFLGLTEEAAERELEDALMARLQASLAEFGAGLAFVGRQVRFDVDGDEFFIDLLLFHVEQLRYVVIEIKARKFQPADAGQLGFYVAMVDDQRRRPGHRPTVGILLCADRNEQVVRYALGSAGAPMAVSTYTYDTLPESERADLPPAEALTAAITPPQARHEPDSAYPGQ